MAIAVVIMLKLRFTCKQVSMPAQSGRHPAGAVPGQHYNQLRVTEKGIYNQEDNIT